jgi:hypothetical protein
MLKQGIVAYIKVLSQHFPGETEMMTNENLTVYVSDLDFYLWQGVLKFFFNIG